MDHLTLYRDNVQQIENHWLLVMFTHEGYHEIAKLIMGYLSASKCCSTTRSAQDQTVGIGPQTLSAPFERRRPDNANIPVLVPRRLSNSHDWPGHLIVEGTDSEP
jgi:hypothetical protein